MRVVHIRYVWVAMPQWFVLVKMGVVRLTGQLHCSCVGDVRHARGDAREQLPREYDRAHDVRLGATTRRSP